MTVDASRSCLGLATCVGAMARQIVVARVLLTAAVPPALPVSAWRRVLPAPPLPVITRFLGSACGDRHLASDGPDKAREFAGDRGGDNIGRLASAGELAIARAQPYLSLPGNVADCLWQLFLPEQQLAADPSREAITPGRLDQQSTGRAVARLGEAAAFDAGPARMLRRHQTEIGHQLARIGETREVAQLGDERCRIDQSHAAHRLQRRHNRASVQSGSIAAICAVSRSRRTAAASTAWR